MANEQIKVEYVDHMGTDLSVVDAARVSFAKKSAWESVISVDTTRKEDSEEWLKDHRVHKGCFVKMSEADAKLINYLAKHEHWTPFAHTAISLRVAAPVPIRTQCFKHKVGLVENEESRRYIKSTPEIFIPEFREKPEGSIKQGSGGIHQSNEEWQYSYRKLTERCVDIYLQMIKEGVAPEQARFVLPQGAIVNWVWTGNLMSFANFYKKRIDPHAQQEIQEVARKVDEVIRPLFPVSWAALVD